MFFFQGHTFFRPDFRDGWSDWQETKGLCIVLILSQPCNLDLGPHLRHWMIQGQLWNSLISEIVCPIGVKRKGSKLVGYRTNYATFLFDHTHDLDLKFPKSKFEIALSAKWEGQLKWNENNGSWSFMTMTLIIHVTFVWPRWGGWMPSTHLHIYLFFFT